MRCVQGKPMMNRFGQLGLTTVSNGLNFVAQTIGILSQTHGQMYAYVMATVRSPPRLHDIIQAHTPTRLKLFALARTKAASPCGISTNPVERRCAAGPGRAQA